MKLIELVPVVTLVLAISATAMAGEDVNGSDRLDCTPGFREVSEDLIVAELGTWRLELKVALIGCNEHLTGIRNESLKRIEAEFKNPTLWSNINLVVRYRDLDLRRTATQRVNEILGENLVSDVLLHDLTLYDDIR